MVKLTEKDADFLAGIFREMIKYNDEAWEHVVEKNNMVKELWKFAPESDEIKNKFKELSKVTDEVHAKYMERSECFQKGLLLCMAGSDNVEE